MKILLINFLYPPDGIGGSERSTKFLAEALVGFGHEVVVVCQALSHEDSQELINGVNIIRLGSPEGYQPNVHNTERVVIEALKVKNKRSYIRFSTRLEEVLESVKPDIVHTAVTPNITSVWEIVNTMNIPVVHTLRSYSLICKDRMFFGDRPCDRWCSRCSRNKKKLIARTSNVSAIVGISQHILRTHIDNELFSDVKAIGVIPNSYAPSDPSLKSTFIQPPDIVNGNIVFGYIGRIHETKGIESFIKSFIRYATKNMQLKIAGEGNEEYVTFLKDKYRSDRIEFVGFCAPEVFLKDIHITVVSSQWAEPFGRVTIESFILSRPVMGTNLGGTMDLIEHDVNGWLYNPYDERDIKGCIRSIAKLDNKGLTELSKNAYEAGKKYTPEIVAEKYIDIYETLMP